jgi:hypothetical protein
MQYTETATFMIFKGMFKSRETLCREAAAFATAVGRERLIGISTAIDSGLTVVTVFYWEYEAVAG